MTGVVATFPVEAVLLSSGARRGRLPSEPMVKLEIVLTENLPRDSGSKLDVLLASKARCVQGSKSLAPFGLWARVSAAAWPPKLHA